jgi:hypothetical protein
MIDIGAVLNLNNINLEKGKNYAFKKFNQIFLTKLLVE